ncbi:MAG: TetR/AcrR family transcriptional regulator [Paracoccaceae bacterium]
MSADEKQKTHERILKAASQLFRERGIETTSVADVMKAAGLTHGGFYRHFASKEALVAAAFSHAVDEVLSDVEAAPSGPDQASALDSYVARATFRPSMWRIVVKGARLPLWVPKLPVSTAQRRPKHRMPSNAWPDCWPPTNAKRWIRV